MESKVDQLERQALASFAAGCECHLVETGRYKGCMPNTVMALARRGYKVERKGLSTYRVFPKVQ